MKSHLERQMKGVKVAKDNLKIHRLLDIRVFYNIPKTVEILKTRLNENPLLEQLARSVIEATLYNFIFEQVFIFTFSILEWALQQVLVKLLVKLILFYRHMTLKSFLNSYILLEVLLLSVQTLKKFLIEIPPLKFLFSDRRYINLFC